MRLNTVNMAHDFLSKYVKKGSICIDATCGRGSDTLFLCSLIGQNGKVFSFDIQEEAISDTKTLVDKNGLNENVEIILDGHENIDKYIKNKVDVVVFNFGWLPRGNHKITTQPATSLIAIKKSTSLLKKGGVMSLSIYCGLDNNIEERDIILQYLESIDFKKFTVLKTEFLNRPNNPPISVFIIRDN